MIIELCSSIDAFAGCDKNALSLAVGELCRAHRRGNHLVVIERGLARWFCANLNLSDLERAMVQRIGQEYTQAADLLRRSETVMAVTVDPTPALRTMTGRVLVNIFDATRGHTLDRAVLLVEDAVSDGDFLVFVCNCVQEHIGAPRINFELAHGGGSRVEAILEQKIVDERVVCTVFDSDKKSPYSPDPKKLAKMTDVVKRTSPFFVALCMLHCHEVENLIPFSIVRDLPCSYERGTSLSVLASIIDQEARVGVESRHTFWSYFDVKLGLCSVRLAALTNEADRDWISKKLEFGGLDKRDFALQGFGANVVSQLVCSHVARSRLRQYIRSKAWPEHIQSLIQEIVWIGAAPIPTRV